MVDLISVPKLSNRQNSKMVLHGSHRSKIMHKVSKTDAALPSVASTMCGCVHVITHTVYVGGSSVTTVEVCIQPCLHAGTSGQSLRSVRVFTSLTLHKRPFPRRTRQSAGYSAVNKDLRFSKTNPGSPSFTGTPYACSLNIIQYVVHHCTDMSNTVSRFPRNKLDL